MISSLLQKLYFPSDFLEQFGSPFNLLIYHFAYRGTWEHCFQQNLTKWKLLILKHYYHYSSLEWSNTLRKLIGFCVMVSPVCQCLFWKDFGEEPHFQHASCHSLTFHFWNALAEDVTSTWSPEAFLMVFDITLERATGFHFWSAVLHMQKSALIQDEGAPTVWLPVHEKSMDGKYTKHDL